MPKNQQNKEYWERFARRRPMYAIATSSRGDAEAFWRSGERTAEFLQETLAPHGTVWGGVLDVGVGMGRVAIPIASLSQHITGVDVSPTMLVRFDDECKKRGIKNCTGMHIDEAWEEKMYDVVYSVLTLQHLEDIQEIKNIFARIAECLSGVGYIQCDTRPYRFGIGRILSFIPNFLLPFSLRKGMRRIARNAKDIRALITSSGLTIVQELHPNSALHGFVVVPASFHDKT